HLVDRAVPTDRHEVGPPVVDRLAGEFDGVVPTLGDVQVEIELGAGEDLLELLGVACPLARAPVHDDVGLTEGGAHHASDTTPAPRWRGGSRPGQIAPA